MAEARAALRAEVAGWPEAERGRYGPLLARLTDEQAADVVRTSLGQGEQLQQFLRDIFEPSPVDGPLQRLARLLEPVYPRGLEANLARRLVAHMPARLARAPDFDAALSLTLEALCFPGPDSEDEWGRDFGYTVGSQLVVLSPTLNAVFLRLFEEGQPRALKIPTDPASAQHALHAWDVLGPLPCEPLVPLLRTLCFTPPVGSYDGPLTAFVLPLYACDASAWVDAAIPSPCVGPFVQRMVRALERLHRVGLCHCSVTPQHVLIDFEGQAVLGGLGHTRYIDAPLPPREDALRPADFARASPLCDWYQLAALALRVDGAPPPPAPMTCADILGLLHAPPAAAWRQQLAGIIAALERTAHPPTAPPTDP